MPDGGGFDVGVCWRLDRLGRNLTHLVWLIEELRSLGVAFVSWVRESSAQHLPASCNSTSWPPSPDLNGPESLNGSRPVPPAFAPLGGAWAGREPVWTLTRPRTAHLSVRAAAKALGVTPAMVQRHRAYRNSSRQSRVFAS
jgi:hypothetical protein